MQTLMKRKMNMEIAQTIDDALKNGILREDYRFLNGERIETLSGGLII